MSNQVPMYGHQGLDFHGLLLFVFGNAKHCMIKKI